MNMHIAAVGTSADDLHIYYYTCIAFLTGHYIPFFISCHHLAIYWCSITVCYMYKYIITAPVVMYNTSCANKENYVRKLIL